MIPDEEDFLVNLPSLEFANKLGIRWMSEMVQLLGFDVHDNSVRIRATQHPEICGVRDFVIEGTLSDTLQFDKGRVHLDFRVRDAFGGSRCLRLYHDGYHNPGMGIETGGEFSPVFFISFDGIKLRLAYRDYQFNPHVATIYTVDPSGLYELGEAVDCPMTNRTTSFLRALTIANVKLLRRLESVILRNGPTYDVGRIGAEIAYTVARERLSLDDTVLVEPSQPGVDLYAAKSKTVIQARMLVQAHYPPLTEVNPLLHNQLCDLLRSVVRDLNRFPSAANGHAILSFTGTDWTTSVIVATVRTENPHEIRRAFANNLNDLLLDLTLGNALKRPARTAVAKGP